MLSTFALDTQVIQKDLCTGCGACQGMCPYWASEAGRTYFTFECDRENGRCQSFCPRMPFDKKALMKKFFDEKTITKEAGPIMQLYLCRAKDASTRKNAQHGGTVTALLEFAIKEGYIDAAVLSKAEEGGLNPEGYLATSAKEIRACSGSSFQIAPTLATLNQALKENKYKKIGVVGTPCKTTAVYKMKAKPLADNDNNVDNIALVIGLFCGWGLDWDGIYALAKKYAKKERILHIDIPPSKYHCMVIKTEKREISVNLDEVEAMVRPACKACPDMTAEFADLSVGGARSSEGWDVDKHWNQILIRTPKGKKLFDAAVKAGVLEVKEPMEGGLDKIKWASLGKANRAKEYIENLK